jgi:hypothetical protein
MKRFALLILCTGFLLACGNKTPTVGSQSQTAEDSIRTAIQAHLATKSNLNLQAFDTDVKQVTIQGDHAQANVEFRVKGGPGAMQLTYALEKRDGAWSVIDSDPVGSNFSHPALGQGQTSRPGAPTGTHSLADTLRSFQISPGPTQALPPGHPPVANNNVAGGAPPINPQQPPSSGR